MNYNADFLAQLDKSQNKTIYVKLISLNYNEQPIEAIEGRATAGSINIDGASAVRRTCQISLLTNTVDISDYYWTLNTKFKVQIGIENTIANFPKIIWFNQGIYLITSFSSNYSASGYTVNISGKDKMCTLNGEIGGVINSSTILDSFDQIDKNGNIRTIKNPIRQIIKELVFHLGKELAHNIIINDLDMTGLELLEYRYDQPLYLIRNEGEEEYQNASLDAKYGNLKQYDSTSIDGTVINSEVFIEDGRSYNIAKIDYGETAGYREIDLVYPSELVAQAGDTITSALDKIKNMLGNYEYFYDVEGRFVFQKKKTYLNTAWTPLMSNEGEQVYVESYMSATPYSYNFAGSTLFTSFNNTPQLNNLKNDFTVWGKNKNDLPIHMRYAIDIRPNYYKSIEVSDEELIDYNQKNNLEVTGQHSIIYWYNNGDEPPMEDYTLCADWREIIFQMQKDYYKYNCLDDFTLKVAAANPNHYPTGCTGYEQYYIDIQGFWRYLYTPVSELLEDDLADYYVEGDYAGWRKIVYETPSQLLFWFDFLDTNDNELSKYSVPVIGARPKVENSNDIKAIYYGETPTIIFEDPNNSLSNKHQTGYRYFNLPNYYNMFVRSTQGKTAKDAIDTLLYNHTYCTESVTIQSVPIYYLQPNTLIHISDTEANIDGDYIISKMTVPLSYNGTMSITGVKTVQRIY